MSSGLDPLSGYQDITTGRARRRRPANMPPGYENVMQGGSVTPPPWRNDPFNRGAQPPPTQSPYDQYGRMMSAPSPVDPWQNDPYNRGYVPPVSPYDERGRMAPPGSTYNPMAGEQMAGAQGQVVNPWQNDPFNRGAQPPPVQSPYDENGRMSPPPTPINPWENDPFNRGGNPIPAPSPYDERGRMVPPGTPPAEQPVEQPDYTASYFDLIDRIDSGALVTEEDIAGMPEDLANRIRGYQDTISGIDISKPANLERTLFQQNMQAMVNPQFYGQGASDLALGRLPQSGVEEQIANMTAQLNTTAESEKANIAAQFQQQREQLARLYAIDPSGRMSGGAQRDFETLGAQEANALAAVDARVREEARQNIQVLTGLQESREGAALNEQQARLQQRQAAAGFLGQQQEQDLATRQQGLQVRQQQFAERQQDVQNRLEEARLALQRGEMIGEVDGAETLAARAQLLQAKQQEQELALEAGVAIGQIGGQRTLAARNADLQEQAFFADQLGYIHDPNSPTGYAQTLAGKAQTFDQAFQTEQFSETVRRFNSEFLGELIDPMTGQVRQGLDAEQVRSAITQANAQLDIAQKQLALDVGRTWATISGTTGVPGPVTAADFGYDPAMSESVPREALPYTAEGQSIRESLRAMSGTEPSDEDIARIMTGQEVQVMGAPTLEAKRLGAEIMRTNLDRALEYKRIADSTGIEWTRLNQAIDESDRQWALQTADVATRNDLDAEKFRLAKWEIEHAAGVDERQLELQTTETANRFGLDVARFNQAITEFGVQSQLQAQTAQAQIADLANRYGLDAARFNQGIDEFNAQIELQRQQTQASIADTANRYGLDVAQFNQAIAEADRTYGLQRTQTLAETAELANRFGLDNAQFNQAVNEFGQTFELQQQQVAAQVADTANRYGLDVAKFNEASNEFAASYVLQQDQSRAQIAELSNRYQLDSAQFNQAINEFNAQYGLSAFTAQANVADIANRYGLDSQKFTQAVSEFDQQMALQDEQIRNQLDFTKEQWAQTKRQVAAQEAREKLYWDGLMKGEGKQVTISLDPKDPNAPKDAAGQPILNDFTKDEIRSWISAKATHPDWTPEQQLADLQSRPNLAKFYNWYVERTGGEAAGAPWLTDTSLSQLARGLPVEITALADDWYDKLNAEERQDLLTLIQGQGVNVVENQGSGFWNAVGNTIGIAAGAYVGAKAGGK